MPEAPREPDDAPRFNAFRWFAEAGVRRPWLIVALGLSLSAASLAYTWNIPLSTSRYALVSAEDNVQQARLLTFFERFGIQDAMVLVLSEGTHEERRRVSFEVCAKLEREPEFRGRTLCRIGPNELAEVALLFDPARVQEQLGALGPPGSLAALVEGGLPAWLAAIEGGMASALGGATEHGEARGRGDSKTADPANRGLGGLVRLLRALDAELGGRDAVSELGLGAAREALPGGIRVDERGFLVGPNDGYHLVAMFPVLPGTEGYDLKPLVDKVRGIVRAVQHGAVRSDLTGLPSIATDELDAVERGMKDATLGTSVGILILLLVGFRSWRFSLLALVPLAVGTVVTTALARGMFGGLNVITSSFVSVLMGIGIDFACFAMSRYSEELRAGKRQLEAMTAALMQTGPPILISAGTTVLAFLTVATTDFTAFKQLGYLVGLGLAAMVLLTFFLCPALAPVLNPKELVAAREFVGLHLLEPVVRRGRPVILGLAVLVTAAGAVCAFKLRFDANYVEFLPAEQESVRGLKLLEGDKGSSPVHAIATADGVERAREKAARLRALSRVASVDTATDLLPPLTSERLDALRGVVRSFGNEPNFRALRDRARTKAEVLSKLDALADGLDEVGFALRQAAGQTSELELARAALKELTATVKALPGDGSEALAALELRVLDLFERAWTTAANVAKRGHYEPVDLPSVFRARFVSKDHQGLAIYVQPAGNIWDVKEAAAFNQQLFSVEPDACGPAVEIDSFQSSILKGFRFAGLCSGLLAFGACWLGFRSVKDSWLALVPVVLGFAGMLGTMVVLDLRVTVANIVSFPLLMGMGVEAGAHIMARCRQSASVRGGVAELADIIGGTGSAVVIAATTTIVGFGALMLADYRAMQALGAIMSVGMTCNLVAALVVLPALLVTLKRAR
ncbi:MAG: hypothetical protein EXR75_01420 [Myxococcales bacterium]|nr:hypothetical protein [Myxococcales bacterium]